MIGCGIKTSGVQVGRSVICCNDVFVLIDLNLNYEWCCGDVYLVYMSLLVTSIEGFDFIDIGLNYGWCCGIVYLVYMSLLVTIIEGFDFIDIGLNYGWCCGDVYLVLTCNNHRGVWLHWHWFKLRMMLWGCLSCPYL